MGLPFESRSAQTLDMVQSIPPPVPRALLPPFLACLPTAFVSCRPAPALLPLLSPILRQRVQLLADGEGRKDSWLSLLSWDAQHAARVAELVSEHDFEPHPASGEIEIGLVEGPRYRRRDEETLQAELVLVDIGIELIYLWCVDDEAGGGSGWRVAELRPLDSDKAARDGWQTSILAANESYSLGIVRETLNGALPSKSNGTTTARLGVDFDHEPARETTDDNEDEDDDDDYWRRYDSTPSRTPGRKISPAPPSGIQGKVQSVSEADYYARYSEVQPAMDNDDPRQHADGRDDGEDILQPSVISDFHQGDPPPYLPVVEVHEHLNHPRPSSSSSSTSEAISRLEDTADAQARSDLALRQHIGTSLKSLYRLAKAGGMELNDFDRLVRTELDVLELMDQEDLQP